jgi:poly(A) polymerase
MDSQYYAIQIVKRLVKEGYTAYFAGGWVRDFVMDLSSADIDIATNAPPEKILDLFPRTILVGLAFGVVVVVIEGHQFEVSTFRRDIGYEDGRKPQQIEMSIPEEDALRRDFTINGMFYDPLEKQIIDYVGGMEDIKKGVIRAIGNPDERFVEDRLRMIRAVRFAARFGFAIEQETQIGIMMSAETLFPSVAKERIWQEFTKMSAYPSFDIALTELHRLGLLPVIFPSLENDHLKDLKHRVSTFPHFPKECPTILYIMELFPYSTLEEQIEICNDLKISSREIRLVEYIFVLREIISTEILRLNEIDLVNWVNMYSNSSFQLCLDVIAARQTEELRTALYEKHAERYAFLSSHIERHKAKKTVITADILQKHGIVPGKAMGLLIKEAEKIAITKNLRDVDAILSILQKNTTLWGDIPPC